MRKTFTEEQLKSALFVGVFPGGIVYADMRREVAGDYKKIAFLPYSSLELEICAPKSDLVPLVEQSAESIQARRGESFSVSSCGQTVLLGSRS